MPLTLRCRRSLCALFTLTAREPAPQLQTIAGCAQGTTYHITWYSAPVVDRGALQQAMAERFARIDAGFSGYRPDSNIEQFNASHHTAPFTVSREIVELEARARTVHAASDGCYDLTIKPV